MLITFQLKDRNETIIQSYERKIILINAPNMKGVMK